MDIRFQQGEDSIEWRINMFPYRKEGGEISDVFISREIDTIEFDGDYGEPVITYENLKNVALEGEPERFMQRVAVLTFPAPCKGSAIIGATNG